MADDQQELTRINWNEALTVTHVFKSFQMARHFGKLMLALAAVLLIWLWGWGLDLVTGGAGLLVPDGEIGAYVATSPAAFEKGLEGLEKNRESEIEGFWRDAHSEREKLNDFLSKLRGENGGGGAFEEAFVEQLNEPNQPDLSALLETEKRDKLIKEDWQEALDQIEDLFEGKEGEVARIQKFVNGCGEDDRARKKIDENKDLTDEKKDEAREKLDADFAAAKRALTKRKIAFARKIRSLRGAPVFQSFLNYESQCLTSALLAVRYVNITGGLTDYRQMLANRSKAIEGLPPVEPTHGLAKVSPAPADDPPGFLYWCLMALHGFCWLFARHWLFAIVFSAVALGIWALFGGAMHRMSALHFARDEKISIGQALRFSASKFFSFYTAPLIPLAIIVAIWVPMFLGGLMMNVPVLDLVMILLFLLALIGGVLIAFLTVGLVGGGGLMYPTIAAESSDSFDAISRSYSYLFAKPWRAAFHGLVALVYGVICYLFVRLVVLLVLGATHCFISGGVLVGGDSLSTAADKLDVIWAAPTFDNLMPPLTWEAMSGWETLLAVILRIWIIPVVCLVTAFLLSYFSSATTVIYFLLRRKVDATDLDDVYVEEPEEEEFPTPEAAEEEPAAEAEEAPSEEEAEAPKPKQKRKKAAKKKAKKKAGDSEGKGE